MKQVISSSGLDPSLQHFDKLPDSAMVGPRVVAALRGQSVCTVWRHVKLGILPKPEMVGGSARWRVGLLRSAA
jgi:hypothetical protein